MRRKLLNSENDKWIIINQARGSFPNNVYADVKTGLYGLLRIHFLEFMKMVEITLKNESDLNTFLHESQERSELDLELKARS